jgi:tetratricopeptide (TPR) repeat protein
MTKAGFVRLLAASVLLTAAQPALADWHEVSSDHFVIYADDNVRVIERFAQNLERYHSAMAYVSGRTLEKPSPSNRVVIYVVGGASDVRELVGGNSRRVAGFYIPRAGASRAFVQEITNQTGYPDFSMIVLLHEYAHHFLMSSSRYAMPRWINEGAAEFFAAATFNEDGSMLIGRAAQHRGPELFQGEPVPLRELLDANSYKSEDRDNNRNAFYGYAWLLYHYLTFSDERAGQLQQYQLAVVQGQSSLEAAKAAFGDLDVLERELRAYRRARMLTVQLSPDKLEAGTIAFRKLSPGEEAIMPLQIRSQRGVNRDQAIEIVAKARAVAARFPDDPGVLTALAEAEFDAGNDAEAIAAADAAIARDAKRINAYVQKGLAMFRQAQALSDQPAAFEAAMQPFSALNQIENDHPLPLMFYYRSYTERGEQPPEIARAALERAARLAPFDQQLQLSTAIMLISEGKNAIARDFLAPVAANPHGGALVAKAKQLIAAVTGVADGTIVDISNLPEEVETPDLSGAAD